MKAVSPVRRDCRGWQPPMWTIPGPRDQRPHGAAGSRQCDSRATRGPHGAGAGSSGRRHRIVGGRRPLCRRERRKKSCENQNPDERVEGRHLTGPISRREACSSRTSRMHTCAALTLEGAKSAWKGRLDLTEQSAQDLLQRETLDEPDLVAIGSKLKRTEAVAA